LKIFNNIPVVWQISALHLTAKRTLFSGVLLSNSPITYDTKIGVLSNLIKVIKSYFIRAYANKEISITSNGSTINTNTDKHGGFQLIVGFQHNGEIKINIAGLDKPLRILQTYPISFHNTNSPFDVISDIDDTIIVSYTAHFFKRVGALVFTPPKKRKVIGFSKKIFAEFRKQDARIFYISKSESNLFGVLTSFITHNNLPKGKLFLTPFSNFYQLLFEKKDKDFKIESIRFLIGNSENKKYVLFGDDSQQDIDIYSKIAREYPRQIIKIYIRQTKNKISPYQKRMFEKLKSSNLPVEYFKADTKIDTEKEISQLKNYYQ